MWRPDSDSGATRYLRTEELKKDQIENELALFCPMVSSFFFFEGDRENSLG